MVLLFARILTRGWFQRAYFGAFSSSEGQATNKAILKLCYRTAGFNPGVVGVESGEFVVAKALSAIGCNSALDIGANFGQYSSMLLRAGFKKIHSFEPHPESFRRLESIARTSSGKIVPHRRAMGMSREKMTLNFDLDALNLASLNPVVEGVPYVTYSDSLEVDVDTVDQFWGEVGSVDFVKIDTEGFERQVLLGAVGAISTLPPCAISLEFNHHHLFTGDSLWSLAQIIGPQYSVFRILPGMNGATEVDCSGPYANVFMMSNYIFVRQDVVGKFRQVLGLASL